MVIRLAVLSAGLLLAHALLAALLHAAGVTSVLLSMGAASLWVGPLLGILYLIRFGLLFVLPGVWIGVALTRLRRRRSPAGGP